MKIEFSCGHVTEKTTDNERCPFHPWAEVKTIIAEEIGFYYNLTYL